MKRKLHNHRVLSIALFMLLLGSIYLNILQYNTPRFEQAIEDYTEEYCEWQESDLGTADENY